MPRRGKPENLKPRWKPGQSGNPKGRPPGPTLTAETMAQLGPEGRTLAARMLARCIAEAVWKPPHRDEQHLTFEQWWQVAGRLLPQVKEDDQRHQANQEAIEQLRELVAARINDHTGD